MLLYANLLCILLSLPLGWLVVLSDGFTLPLIFWAVICLAGFIWHWFSPNFYNSTGFAIGMAGAAFGILLTGVAFSSYCGQTIKATDISQINPLPKGKGDVYLELQEPSTLNLPQLIIQTHPRSPKYHYDTYWYYAPFEKHPTLWLRGSLSTEEVWNKQQIQAKIIDAAKKDANQTRFLSHLQDHGVPAQLTDKDIQFISAWPQVPPKGFDWVSLFMPNLLMNLIYGLLYFIIVRLWS